MEGRNRWISSLLVSRRCPFPTTGGTSTTPYHPGGHTYTQLAHRSSASSGSSAASPRPGTAVGSSSTGFFRSSRRPRSASAAAGVSLSPASFPRSVTPPASLRFESWTTRLERTPARATCGVEEVAKLCLQQEGKHHYAFFRPCGASPSSSSATSSSSPSSAARGTGTLSTPQDYQRLLHLLAAAGNDNIAANLAVQISSLLFDLLRKPVHPQRGAASAWDLTNREVQQIKEEVIRLMMSRVLRGEAALRWLVGALGLEVHAPNGIIPEAYSLRALDEDQDPQDDDNPGGGGGVRDRAECPSASPSASLTASRLLTSALLHGWSPYLTAPLLAAKQNQASSSLASSSRRPFAVTFIDPHGEMLLFSSETIGLVASAMLQEARQHEEEGEEQPLHRGSLERTAVEEGRVTRFEVLRLLDVVRRARLSCGVMTGNAASSPASTAISTAASATSSPTAARLLARVNMKEIIVRCAEVAAQQGDPETVTRLIFLLSRSEGTLSDGSTHPTLHHHHHHHRRQHHDHCPPAPQSHRRSSSSARTTATTIATKTPRESRRAWLRSKWSAMVVSLWGNATRPQRVETEGAAHTDAATADLDQLTTRLLKSAIHASLVQPSYYLSSNHSHSHHHDRGHRAAWEEHENSKSLERLEEAHHLFVALADGGSASWSAAAAMAVELLTFAATWQQEAYQALAQQRVVLVGMTPLRLADSPSRNGSESKPAPSLLKKMKRVAELATGALAMVRERLPGETTEWTSGQRTVFVTCVELVCRTLTGLTVVSQAAPPPPPLLHGSGDIRQSIAAEQDNSSRHLPEEDVADVDRAAAAECRPLVSTEVPVVSLPFTVRVPVRCTSSSSASRINCIRKGEEEERGHHPVWPNGGAMKRSTLELATHACVHYLFSQLWSPNDTLSPSQRKMEPAFGAADYWLTPLLPFELLALSEEMLSPQGDHLLRLGRSRTEDVGEAEKGIWRSAPEILNATLLLCPRHTPLSSTDEAVAGDLAAWDWDVATGGLRLYAGLCQVAASIGPQRLAPLPSSFASHSVLSSPPPSPPSPQPNDSLAGRFSQCLRDAPSAHRQLLWTVLSHRPHSGLFPQDCPPRFMESLSVALYSALRDANNRGPELSLFTTETAETHWGEAIPLLQALYHVGCPPEKPLLRVVDSVLAALHPAFAGLRTTSLEEVVRQDGMQGRPQHGSMVVVVTSSVLAALCARTSGGNPSAESLLSSIRSLGGLGDDTRVTFAMTRECTLQILSMASRTSPDAPTTATGLTTPAHPLLRYWQEALRGASGEQVDESKPESAEEKQKFLRLPHVRVRVLPPLDWCAESGQSPWLTLAARESGDGGGRRVMHASRMRMEGCPEALHIAAVAQRCCPAERRPLVFWWREDRHPPQQHAPFPTVAASRRGGTRAVTVPGGHTHPRNVTSVVASGAAALSDPSSAVVHTRAGEDTEEDVFGPQWRQCQVRLLSIQRAQLSKAKSDIRAVCSAARRPVSLGVSAGMTAVHDAGAASAERNVLSFRSSSRVSRSTAGGGGGGHQCTPTTPLLNVLAAQKKKHS